MRVVIREVRAEDAQVWLSLRQALWPDADPSDLRSTVDAFFGSGTPLVAAAFLACGEASAIGFIELSIRAYVPGATKLPAPFVEGWFVAGEARRQGVGRQLVAAAERWARQPRLQPARLGYGIGERTGRGGPPRSRIP